MYPVLRLRLFLQLAHKGRESALGSDGLEAYSGHHAKKKKIFGGSGRTGSFVSQRRRNKPPPRSSMGYLAYLASRRRFLFKSSWESKGWGDVFMINPSLLIGLSFMMDLSLPTCLVYTAGSEI